jgi:Flp pilus assembly pilin Flp
VSLAGQRFLLWKTRIGEVREPVLCQRATGEPMEQISKVLQKLLIEERGQNLVEYGLIVAFLSIVVLGIPAAFSGDMQGLYNNISIGLSKLKI